MGALIHDVRHALRVLAREKGFTAIAVLTLALGIGASTAMFTVVDGVLLRPLPYPEPDRLVQLVEISAKGRWMDVPEANVADWRARSRSFERMTMHSGASPSSFAGEGEPVRAGAALVSEGFFEVMGVAPHLGRGFGADDHRRGGARVALVSHAVWQRVLGGARDVGSLALRQGDRTVPVVGVMPPGFSYPPGAEVWFPMETGGAFNPSRSAHNWRVIARLRPGVSAAQASADLQLVAGRIHREHAGVTAISATAIPLKTYLTRNARPALLVLLAAVGALLLVACANVASLLLAHGIARERELALRSALGATRARLVRQSVTECMLLALLGGAAGALLAFWGVDAMLALASGRLARGGEVGVDLRVLGFGLLVSTATGVGLGLIAAWRSTRGDLQATLREGSRTMAGDPRRHGARSALVVAQVGMALALLVGCGLLGRSLWKTLDEDLGFAAGDQLTVDLLVPAPAAPDRDLRLARFHRELGERVAALPGVIAAGGINHLPLSGRSANGRFELEGGGDSGDMWPNYLVVSPGYFAAMGIPLLGGRLLAESDAPDAPHVAVVSQAVARRVWPGDDAIGRRIVFGNMDGDARPITIVGVVGDVRHDGPEASPRGAVYLHVQQRPRRSDTFTLVVRTAGEARRLIPEVRREVQALDPTVAPVFRPLAEHVSAVVSERRFNLTLIGAFGATALLLAALGIYGVVSFSVARRTREIGIRVALGASSRLVVGQFLREGGRLALAGVALGLVAAAALSRLMASLLYGTSAHDPPTYAAVAALLLLVALVASWIPALRASRVDPMVALRRE
jgi:predicted permease